MIAGTSGPSIPQGERQGTGLAWMPARAAHMPPLRRLRALRRLDRWIVRLPIIAATFVSKVGIPGLGTLALTLSIPLIYIALGIGSLTGRLVIAPLRFAFFVAMCATLWLTQVLSDRWFSPASLLMLTVMHFPYCFNLRSGAESAVRAWAFFRQVAVVIALFGIAQYGLQFVIGPDLAFPLETFMPTSMKVEGFNVKAWIEYGSSTMRSNGVFMLEPSFFSQLLAVAIALELMVAKPSLWRLALYTVATLVSYSGTGLMALAICLPVWLVAERKWSWLLSGLGVALAFVMLMLSGAFADNPFVKVFADRSTEFASPDSSGFARFVGGYYMFQQYLAPDSWRALFGFGAGTFLPYSTSANYAAHGMALFKMVFEFGVIGALVYFGFLAYCFHASRAPLVLKIAIFVPLMIQNYVPFAHGLAFSLLIWNIPRHPVATGVRS